MNRAISHAIRLALVLGALAGFSARAATITVTMVNTRFSPASVTINTGDTIVWTNADFLTHNVTSTSSPSFTSSGNFGPGGSYSFTFTIAATYSYVCTIHPGMTGTVIVQAANQPPAVGITSPTNGMKVLAGTTQTIQATATDSDGTVTKVDFYASGNFLGTVSAQPFNLTVTNIPAGNFALTAVAYDNAGASNISAAVNIQSLTNATLVPDPALPNQPAFHIANSVPGQTYFIDALTNFTGAFGARWFPIATNTAPSGDFTFSDAVVPAGLPRLYRVRQTY